MIVLAVVTSNEIVLARTASSVRSSSWELTLCCKVAGTVSMSVGAVRTSGRVLGGVVCLLLVWWGW